MKNIKSILKIAISSAILTVVFSSCQNRDHLADAYGNFELDKTFISAQAQGQILWLKIEEGQKLLKGEWIGQIDTMSYHFQKQQLIAQKSLSFAALPDIQAQANVYLQQKESTLINKTRIDNLFAKEAATQKQVDDINAALDLIKAQLQAVETQKTKVYEQIKTIDSQINTLNYHISQCAIITPISGKVLTQLSRTGEMAAPGKALFSAAPLEDIRLKAYVSGAQLPHIKLGEKVEVQIDKNSQENQSMDGEIVWISEQAEFTPKTVQTKDERVNLVYAIKIKCANNGQLKAGMPGEVYFK